MFKFEFGEILKDIYTGYTGVVMGRTDYFSGCRHCGLLCQKLDKENKIQEWVWLDESRLVRTGEIFLTPKNAAEPGGPMPAPPEM